MKTARDAGVPVVRPRAVEPRACTAATLAGVETIEHGDAGDVEVFRLLAKHNVGYCPTLAAAEAYARYFNNWQPGKPETKDLLTKRQSFKAALEAGVTIVNGSDIGVFAHGDGARELELLVEYGMTPVQALKAATSRRRQVAAPGGEDRDGEGGTPGRPHRCRRRPHPRHHGFAKGETGDERRHVL